MLSFSEILSLLKASNWIKNSVILFPAFFSLTILNEELLLPLFLGVLGFSLLSSSVYVINDLFDKESDQKHETKSKRPIASGKVSVKSGVFIALFLLLVSVSIGVYLDIKVFFYFISYSFINLLYSYKLKSIGIIDLLCIGSGFLFRIMVGATIAQVYASYWILILTFLMAIFFPLVKRMARSASDNNPYPFYSGVNFHTVLPLLGGVILVAYGFFCFHQITERDKSMIILLSIVPTATALFELINKSLKLSQISDPIKFCLRNKIILPSLIIWVVVMAFAYYN